MKTLSETLTESLIAEAGKTNDGDGKVENEAEFRSYATEVLKDAHGDKYDAAKAKKTIDGLIKKYGKDGDFGDAIGALTNGLDK